MNGVIRRNFSRIVDVTDDAATACFWQLVATDAKGRAHIAFPGMIYLMDWASKLQKFQSELRPCLRLSTIPMSVEFPLNPSMYIADSGFRAEIEAKARKGGEANAALSEIELLSRRCILMLGPDEMGRIGSGAIYWSEEMARRFPGESSALLGGEFGPYEFSLAATLTYPASIDLVEPEWHWAKSEDELFPSEGSKCL